MMIANKIRKCALDLLARREHSKFELQRKLSAKGFAADDIAKLIVELASQGLQSDIRFGESYVNMRSGRGFGPLRIKTELGERGIDQELIKKFLTAKNFDWFVLAEISRAKKFGKTIPQDLYEQMRQMRYLYYKGFTNDQIRKIFRLSSR